MAEKKSETGEDGGTVTDPTEAEQGEEETLDARDVLFALCYEAHQKGEKYRLTYDALEEALGAAGLTEIWEDALDAVEGEDNEDEDEDEDAEGDTDDDED